VSDPARLETRGLTRRYGASYAVAGVSLRVPAGSIHGLLGRNGAGKTTFIAMLLGLVRPDAGSILVDGAPVAPFGDGVPSQVAGVLDGPRFRPGLSGRANLALLGAYDGRTTGRRTARRDVDLQRLLEQVGLAARADEPVRGYSLGMRQRLGLAAALLRRPRLLVLDEPANGLDPAGAVQVGDLLRRLQGQGVSILLSSHDLDQVEDLCADVTVLRHGTVAYQGTVDHLRRTAPAPTVRLSTSDDALALTVGSRLTGVEVSHANGAAGAAAREPLVVRAGRPELDRYVLALGRTDVAVRSMSVERTSLHAAFHAFTADDGPRPPVTPRALPPGTPSGTRAPVPSALPLPGVAS
jgi:ABC-2 type transport system ATP-binding protein